MIIALLPALFLGSNSIITAKINGRASQGTLGTTVGAFLFAVVVSVCYVLPQAGPAYVCNPRIWLVGVCSGIFWAIGSFGQFSALKPLGVSIAMPISTAAQVVGNALMAAIVLRQWTTVRVWILGLIAIILVSVGAVLCSAKSKAADAEQISPQHMRSGLISLAVSTAGFVMYFLFPNLMHQTGFINDAVYNAPDGKRLYYMTAVILPQSIGQVIAALVIIIAIDHAQSLIFTKKTALNIITGLAWAIGNVLVFISAANPHVGQAVATTFSQLGVVVSTYGGIVLLKEHKTKGQMLHIVAGTICIVVGAVIMGLYTTA